MKFQQYLEKTDKKIDIWPDDVFRIDEDGNKIEGKFYIEWLTFRATVIRDFTSKVRQLVNEINYKTKRNVKLSVYLGSWYDTIYENGINWASENFRYDKRLGFVEDRIYKYEYYLTGYIRNFDYIFIGTYQKNLDDIKRYITLGNILVNGEVPICSSLDLSALTENSLSSKVFYEGLKHAEGIMLFDLITCNFDAVGQALADSNMKF